MPGTHVAPSEIPPAHRLLLNPVVVARFLGAITALLVVADIVTQLAHRVIGGAWSKKLSALFDLDRELNIPSCFATLLLLGAVLLLTVIVTLERKRGSPDVPYWTVLALGFLFMAFDENCSLHERTVDPMRALLSQEHLGIFYYAWVIPAGILVAGLGLFFLSFLRRLPAQTRRACMIAGCVYVGGAVGVESLSGWCAESQGKEAVSYLLSVVLEEGLEMAGAILFIKALLGYLQTQYPQLHLQLADLREG